MAFGDKNITKGNFHVSSFQKIKWNGMHKEWL